MEITLDNSEVFELYPYLEVGTGTTNEGNPIILDKELPIYVGSFKKVNSDIDFLIICSDLQGVVEKNGDYKLLGEELPEYLRLLIEVELAKSEEAKIAVLLCGDLFTSLEKRGASGDVRQIWLAFKEQFNWVIGVAGNHDRFGNDEELEEFKSIENIFLLHKEIIEKQNLQIGGISGIIGRSNKVNRVEERDYLVTLKKLLNKELDIILLHETLDFPELQLIGNPKIRELIETGEKSNICCGHCHWEKTIVEFENSSHVINADSKVVILSKNES